MRIPGLGELTEDDDLEWFVSGPVPVPVLGDAACRFIVEGREDDEAPEDFDAAIAAFLALDPSVLAEAAPHVYAYYRDIMDDVLAEGDDEWYVAIDGPHAVFDHVRLGDEPHVTRDAHGDRRVYVSVECGCDWEPEHGLQLVFQDGRTVSKVGPYNGHVTNANAYDDDNLIGVVYRPAR